MVVVLGAQSFGCQRAELEVRTHGWARSLGAPQNSVQAGADQSSKAFKDPLELGYEAGGLWWDRLLGRLGPRMTLGLAKGRSLALRVGAMQTGVRETS